MSIRPESDSILTPQRRTIRVRIRQKRASVVPPDGTPVRRSIAGFCLVDLSRRGGGYLPKWAWTVLIVIHPLVGIGYLILGKTPKTVRRDLA